jgi:uncharacterized NAD(P)/FAD-binding protein YdhS
VTALRAARSIALIGAGPTASSLLERLVASVPELLGDHDLVVHVIDPFAAGRGRVWRPDLSRLLWMNSMAEDVTMFSDSSVSCEGPIRPGPSLFDWARDHGREVADPLVADELARLDGMSFPTRRVQSAYLEWFFDQILVGLPGNTSIEIHAHTAVDLMDDADGSQVVVWSISRPPMALISTCR